MSCSWIFGCRNATDWPRRERFSPIRPLPVCCAAPGSSCSRTFDADELVVEALRSGASGFLLKDTPPEDLVAAVHAVATGEPTLSPSVVAQLMAHVAAEGSSGTDRRESRARRARELLATLTDREREVAFAIGQGMSNADIADDLAMSVPTVKTHVSRLLSKLYAENRVQIALVVHDADTA